MRLLDLDGPVFIPLLIMLFLSGTGLAIRNTYMECRHNGLLVTVTAYRPIRTQTDSSPNWTSTGTPAVMGICAASRDLLESGQLNYGDIISVPKLGVYKVMDTMNIRHKKHIDILVYTKVQEQIVGWRKNVLIVRVTCNDKTP